MTCILKALNTILQYTAYDKHKDRMTI